MTLDEAIKHVEEVAEKNEIKASWYFGKEGYEDYVEYAKEQRQLAEWLKELKQLKEKKRWIPVSERLPNRYEFVNCTLHSLIDDRPDWVVETIYVPQFPNSPYSDWGNIPMLNWGECKVVAWMYRDIPEPYKPESVEEYGKI